MRIITAGQSAVDLLREPDRHPVLARDERRCVAGTRLEGVGESAKSRSPFASRGPAPGTVVEGPARGANSRVDVASDPSAATPITSPVAASVCSRRTPPRGCTHLPSMKKRVRSMPLSRSTVRDMTTPLCVREDVPTGAEVDGHALIESRDSSVIASMRSNGGRDKHTMFPVLMHWAHEQRDVLARPAVGVRVSVGA